MLVDPMAYAFVKSLEAAGRFGQHHSCAAHKSPEADRVTEKEGVFFTLWAGFDRGKKTEQELLRGCSYIFKVIST